MSIHVSALNFVPIVFILSDYPLAVLLAKDMARSSSHI